MRTGSVSGRCTFGESLARALDSELLDVYHVADLGDVVAVSGNPGVDEGEDLNLHVAKLIASSLGDSALRELSTECARILGRTPPPGVGVEG